MNENIGDSVVKNTPRDSRLTKNKQGKTKSKKNSGFKLIPRRREAHRVIRFQVPLAILCPDSALPRAGCGVKLFVTENDTSRTMSCDDEDLP